MTTPTLRLDKSKVFSTVHGDRTPEDPMYRVHFWQDGLPYDADGLLVADNGNDQDVRELRPDESTGLVRTIMHKPLYSAEMRAKVKRKLDRLAGAVEVKTDDGDPIDEVNLEGWLRGETDYETHEIYGAILKRHKKKVYRLRDAVETMIYEMKVLPEDAVHPDRIAVLDRAA